jgi:kynurenine formamidase
LPHVVDLTHPLSNATPPFPGEPEPRFEQVAAIEEDGYALMSLQLTTHLGTHVDAPAHVLAGAPTLDALPPDRLVVEALRLDVSQRDPHGPIPLAELEPHLDGVRVGDAVLFYSGNARRWGSEAYWTSWSFPDADATRALVERGVSAVGFDGPSADPVDSATLDLHRIWFAAGCIVLENLTNLDRLPERSQVVIAPLKVEGADGAPARVLALLA